MDNFAFVIHPLEAKQIAQKFPPAKYLSEKTLEKVALFIPPMKASNISGIHSKYNSVNGWFVACPLTSRQMISLPLDFVLKRIIKAGQIAEKLGARVLGLGAFTKVVGDAGISIARALKIPVTTGNSYTIATAIEGTFLAAKQMGININEANVVIIGATGAIGKVCSHIMARNNKYLTLVGKDQRKLELIAAEILYEEGVAVKITQNIKEALSKADIIITVTSAIDSVIDPLDIKPGAVICDVARPRDVSRKVVEIRNDILVIEGGVVEVPGDVDFGFNFGFPPKMAYACMAETMILALERKYESYTLGRNITVKQVEGISKLAQKHGFKIAGLRSFEKTLDFAAVSQIKKNALNKISKNNASMPISLVTK